MLTHRHSDHGEGVPCSPVNCPRHGSGLPGEVEVEVKGVQVQERGLGHTADGALGNLCKHRVA